MGVIGYRQLARVIEDICAFGVPTGKHYRDPDVKAGMIARLIFKTIAKGLERDGIVKIEGFGTFKIKHYPKFIKNVPISFKHPGRQILEFPERYEVKFRACRAIRIGEPDGL